MVELNRFAELLYNRLAELVHLSCQL